VRSRGPGTLLCVPKDPENDGGAHKKKGRLRCHKRPKSREETPKEGSDSGVGLGGRYRIPLAKTIASAAQLNVRDHGPIQRFMALALKAEHFRSGSKAEADPLNGHFRSTPESGHQPDRSAGPLRARSRHSARSGGWLAPLAGALRRLRIVGGIGIVLGYSRDQPASGERLQVRLQRVSSLLGIDLSVIHVECKGFQILFPLRRILDRRLRPLVERIVFDAVLFCCGDILRKGVELALQLNAMLGEDIEQRR
jgi:hypothetical protein